MTTSTQTPPNTALTHGRYELLAVLGAGSQGETSLALDHQSQTRVLLKELHFGHLDTLKALDLFERESRVLEGLSHPGIPAYLDTFHLVESDGKVARYFLVQEYIEGKNLRDVVAAGELFDEARVRQVLEELLAILDYLHAQNPPIIHRDIKPSNIMMRPNGEGFALIDFGAVQQKIIAASGSSTIVGTSGYIPREQLMGRALPASDLYALGATAAFLLSHTSPSEMLNDEMTLDFRRHVHISEAFADYLAQLLTPYPEDRIQSAQKALEYLENPSRLPAPHLPVPTDTQMLRAHDPRATEHSFETSLVERSWTALKQQLKTAGAYVIFASILPLIVGIIILIIRFI